MTVILVFFRVTTCLYLSPSSKAKSLSILIAVTVNKDAEHKVAAVTKIATLAKWQRSHLWFTTDIQYVMVRGSAVIATQRSVTARLRYRSLDGGWSEVSLRRAARITMFPRNAMIDIKTFSAERKINSLWTSAVNSAEQNSSREILCSVVASVKFAGAIRSRVLVSCLSSSGAFSAA